MYYDTHDLFSITKSKIHNKEKHEKVKVIIPYKSVMEKYTIIWARRAENRS